MATDMEALTQEIRKIVLAPYAVCLKPLHNVLRRMERATIKDWAFTHESEATRLAVVVVQGLALWPYTLDIIDHLVHAPAIRIAILNESPGLLNHLLERITDEAEGSSIVASLCVSLLSEPLPAGLPLPAAAQTFLSLLFERASAQPSVATIEPVYLLLDGACADLLELLPQTSLDALRDQLTQMMRTAKKIEEQPLSLYCLAIIAKLNKFHHEVGIHASKRSSVQFTPSSQRGLDTSSHSWDEVQKFFNADRALKTIHLLVLQVIYACRTDVREVDDEAVKNVRIAREVLSAIEIPSRSRWTCSNGIIVKKLHEKIGHPGLTHVLQLEGIAFSALLQTPSVQTSTIGSTLVKALSGIDHWRLHDRHINNALCIALPSIASELNEDFWKTSLSRICNIASAENGISLKRTALNMLVNLGSAIRLSGGARQALKAALRDRQLKICMQGVLCVSDKELDRAANDEREWTIKLVAELCCFIMAATLSELDLPNSSEQFDMIALNKLRHIVAHQRLNSNLQPWQMPSVSLNEQSCTPEQQGASRDWQQRLALELNLDTRHRQDSITRLIGEICRDLQDRCDHAEKPLRAQEAKYEDLKVEFTKLQSRAQELQNQIVCQATEIEALQRSKIQVQEDLEGALTECDNIMQEKESIQITVERARANDAQMFQATKRDLESEILELRTTLACNEERLDEQSRETIRLKEQLVQTSELREQEIHDFSNEKASYESSLVSLQEYRRKAEDTINRQQTQLADVDYANTKLSNTIESLRAEMEAYRTQTAEELASVASINKSLREDLQNLHNSHSTKLESANNSLVLAKQECADKLDVAESHYAQLREHMTDELHSKDAVIVELRRKAQRYADEYQKKAAQLEEAQRMRSRLLTAIGLDNNSNDLRDAQEKGRGRRRSTKKGRTSMPGTQLEMDATVDDDRPEDLDLNISPDDEDDGGSDTAFGSPLASFGVHQQAAPSQHYNRRPQQARVSAFEVPTMRPTANAPKTLCSPPRRRQTHHVQPLADVSGELGNKDMGRSPRRMQSDAVKLGEREKEIARWDENSQGIVFD